MKKFIAIIAMIFVAFATNAQILNPVKFSYTAKKTTNEPKYRECVKFLNPTEIALASSQ